MITVLLIGLGLILGSFVNAAVWRLHEQGQGKDTEGKGQENKKRAVVPVKHNLSILNGRSMCPHCRHELAVKDLVPVLSWLALRGKCRYCHKPIGWQYPVVELATAGVFVLSYLEWPWRLNGVGALVFALWLLCLVFFMVLFVYDQKWFLLPDRVIYPLIAVAVVFLIVKTVFFNDPGMLLGGLWGILIIGGLFYALFQVSDGSWIGGGDVKLGVALGLLVGGPVASLMLLFVASCTGTLVSLPLLLTGKAEGNTRIPFGPLLIVGAVITVLFGSSLFGWYKSLLY